MSRTQIYSVTWSYTFGGVLGIVNELEQGQRPNSLTIGFIFYESGNVSSDRVRVSVSTKHIHGAFIKLDSGQRPNTF